MAVSAQPMAVSPAEDGAHGWGLLGADRLRFPTRRRRRVCGVGGASPSSWLRHSLREEKGHGQGGAAPSGSEPASPAPSAGTLPVSATRRDSPQALLVRGRPAPTAAVALVEGASARQGRRGRVSSVDGGAVKAGPPGTEGDSGGEGLASPGPSPPRPPEQHLAGFAGGGLLKGEHLEVMPVGGGVLGVDVGAGGRRGEQRGRHLRPPRAAAEPCSAGGCTARGLRGHPWRDFHPLPVRDSGACAATGSRSEVTGHWRDGVHCEEDGCGGLHWGWGKGLQLRGDLVPRCERTKRRRTYTMKWCRCYGNYISGGRGS